MSQPKDFQHFKLQKDEHKILWLCFDKHEANVNTLDTSVFNELEVILDTLESDLTGLVLYSGKKSGFIAGANIEKFKAFKDKEEAKTFIEYGQNMCQKMADVNIRTVAMINGFCLGGGLELALACDWRVASEDVKKNIGLPEVMLGIHPGWGGSVRLPALIGAPNALNLIMSGRSVNAKTAKKMGFVDAAVPLRQLKNAATHYILNNPPRHKPGFIADLTNHKLFRPLVAHFARNKLKQKIQEKHYPAPFKILDNWQQYGIQRNIAYKKEAESLTELALSDTARNLVRVFFLQESLKKQADKVEFKAKHVHVIGAGVMGGDIAAYCALKGLKVTLQETNLDAIGKTMARAYKLVQKKLKKPRLITAVLDNLIPDPEGLGVKKADVIIEAIFENLEAKQTLFKDLEKKAQKHAVLATNTSSIPLDEISSELKHPERLVGIHFFNPVAKMQLVEVVKSEKSDETHVLEAVAFVKQISRLPVIVKSSPGFLVNRALMPYLMECLYLIDEGVSKEMIDKAALDFGMPMGPVELADTVGLDICLSVARNLTEKFGGEIPKILEDMVEKGELGKKTSKGFYTYKKGKAVKQKVTETPNQQIAERMVLRMVNETFACLREKVIKSSDHADTAMIFGTGFAPFRGGPIQYANDLGLETVREKLVAFTKTHGERFQPDESLS